LEVRIVAAELSRTESEETESQIGIQGAAVEGIRLCQEDLVCELKLQGDCDKSVARIGLVKTIRSTLRRFSVE
jgi:hypothetical protein